MKKSKLFIVALIAVLMVGGLVLTGCHIACDGAGTCEIKNGKGSYCSNISYSSTSYIGVTGCAATISANVSGGNAKCDC